MNVLVAFAVLCACFVIFNVWLLFRLLGLMDDVRFLAECAKRRYGGEYRRTPAWLFVAVIGFAVALFALGLYLDSLAPLSALTASSF